MTHLFPLQKSPRTDHCEECGAEQYEGCGELSSYLVVILREEGDVLFYGERDYCDICADEMRMAE